MVSGKVTGVIDNIEFYASPDKIVVSLKPDRFQLLFIEFRARRTTKVLPFKINDSVTVTVAYEGRVSKSGTRYNNVVGRSILKNITDYTADESKKS